MRIIIAGGGWSGCAAAIAARKCGAEVELHERTDMLLGTGLVGGIMRNNGRFTATEEAIALGGGDLFDITDACARHRGIDFPGHKHANLYDIATTPMSVTRHLESLGIEIHFQSRICEVTMSDRTILSIGSESGETFAGDVFIDTTGTAGPMNNCIKHGNGCAMCILRCPSFGGRVSVTGLTGVEEMQGRKGNGTYRRDERFLQDLQGIPRTGNRSGTRQQGRRRHPRTPGANRRPSRHESLPAVCTAGISGKYRPARHRSCQADVAVLRPVQAAPGARL